jgi:hypothetical protein
MIKKIYTSLLLLSCTTLVSAQVRAVRNLGSANTFVKNMDQVSALSVAENRKEEAVYSLPTPFGTSLSGIVNLKITEDDALQIAGSAGNGSFSLRADSHGRISGTYTSVPDRSAFKYSTDQAGNVTVKDVPIESVLCMDYKAVPQTAYDLKQQATASSIKRTTAYPKFNSKPDSKYVIYIDLDGETSTSPFWNNGQTIYAQPLATYSDADVELIWEVAAQDYLPYDVNVTTDRAVFDAANKYQRKMCIVTKTTTAGQPGIGGIAKIGSFSDGYGDPCWVFNPGPKVTGETVSHEVGHTVDLNHDGKNNLAYYQGHNNWAPIMGAAYSTSTVTLDNPNVMGQWSAGEYSGATNTSEDDVVIIGTHNGFGFRADEYGDTYTAAGKLNVEENGTVMGEKNQGIIGRRKDLDVLKFTCGAGDISLTVAPYYKTPDLNKHPNLNIKLRLLNASGTELASADPVPPTAANTFAAMAATITKTGLAAGTYYLEIDGVGNGTNASTGYTDYASIGGYNISGSLPVVTGIDTREEKLSQLNIFPNPNNGEFAVTFNAAAKSDYVLEVFNTLGQRIYEEALHGFNGAYSGQLNVQPYGKGMYLVSIADGSTKLTKRVVVH